MKDIKIFACPTAEEFTKEICDTLSLKWEEWNATNLLMIIICTI